MKHRAIDEMEFDEQWEDYPDKRKYGSAIPYLKLQDSAENINNILTEEQIRCVSDNI